MNRDKLLTWGLALALFAVAATAFNVTVLPFARACYGYSAWVQLPACALSLLLFGFAGAYLQRTDLERLERTARTLRFAGIAALFVIQLALGYLMEYTPMGDNHMIYDGAQMLAAQGNFDGADYGLYLARFSNQWGFVLILTGFFKLLMALGVTQMFFPCVLVQAVLYALAMRSLLGIARRLYGVRGELMTSMLLALCLPLYLAAGVLYTDTFSLPFVVFTLDFALRVVQTPGKRLLHAALCGVMALIGCQIKMTVAIVLIAAALVWLLRLRLRHALPAVLLSALILLCGTQAIQGYMKNQVLDPAMVDQHHTPLLHWIAMSVPRGDNPYGSYSTDYNLTWGMQDEGASREAVMESIYGRLKDRLYTLRYPNRLLLALLRKNASSQGDGTFGMTDMLDDGPVRENPLSDAVLEGRPYYALYGGVTSGIWSACLLLCALAIARNLRRGDRKAAIPAVALLGIQMFLLLWEARSRYMFNFMPVVLVLSASGALHAAQIKDSMLHRLAMRRAKKTACDGGGLNP